MLRKRLIVVIAALLTLAIAGIAMAATAVVDQGSHTDLSRGHGPHATPASRVETLTKARSAPALASCPRAVRRQGWIAVAARGRVELVDLATCRVTVLHADGMDRVRFSSDGRWLAYSRLVNGGRTRPVVVSVQGGAARSPLGSGILGWSWAPNRDVLYGITATGSVVAASPTGRRRIVSRPAGGMVYGASFGVSPDGEQIAVDRTRCRSPSVGELDTITLRTHTRTVALGRADEPVSFAGWSPDGRRLLFWPTPQCSASIAADGGPLMAVLADGGRPAQAVHHMLFYADFLSWCGRRLIAAAGPDRETNTGSTLIETQPPAWRAHTITPARRLSWVSPSCAPSGRVLAAAAGPDHAPVSFGHEHRSIWLLRPDGTGLRRLNTPPAPDLSDEAPRFSRDGRWILFVRTKVVPVGRTAISRDTIELVRADGAGRAVPIIDFTSEDFSYYDHFDWPAEIAWHQAR